MSRRAGFERLLAKRAVDTATPASEATLPGHAAATAAVATAVFDVAGETSLRQVALDPGSWGAPLARVLGRSAWLHDLGKATDQWQTMIRAPASTVLALRHEVVSCWAFVSERGPARWMLEGCDELERAAVLAAVLGHHLQVGSLEDLRPRAGSGQIRVRVLASHSDFAELLGRAAEHLGLKAERAAASGCSASWRAPVSPAAARPRS